jgi:hypothetical protein
MEWNIIELRISDENVFLFEFITLDVIKRFWLSCIKLEPVECSRAERTNKPDELLLDYILADTEPVRSDEMKLLIDVMVNGNGLANKVCISRKNDKHGCSVMPNISLSVILQSLPTTG